MKIESIFEAWEAQVSLTLRLAVYCAALAGTMVAAVMGLSYWQFSSALQDRAHAELFGEHRLIRKEFVQAPNIATMERDARAFDGLRIDHPGLSVAVLPLTGGQPLATRGSEGMELAARVSNRNWEGVYEFNWETCLLAAVIGPVTTQDGKVYRLTVGIDRTADRDLLATYRNRLLAGWFGCILLIGMLAGGVAYRSLRPLRRFSIQVAAVSAEQLGRRVNGRGVPAELRQLADAFNHLLANLDDAFSRLHAFSSDIAHELRGPLANLVGVTQLTLTRARNAEEYRHALESNAEELERLTRMVEDMLFLARAENVSTALTLESVELHELCSMVADFYEIGARERDICIEVSGRGTVRADRNLVRRAIGNLLSNAIRYSSAPSVIRLRVEADADGHTAIHVVNSCVGLAPELHPRLFDRFWRGDTSRHRTGTSDGTGLGLAIVRSIMTLHGGTVTFNSAKNGVTTFTLRFEGGTEQAAGVLSSTFSGHALPNI